MRLKGPRKNMLLFLILASALGCTLLGGLIYKLCKKPKKCSNKIYNSSLIDPTPKVYVTGFNVVEPGTVYTSQNADDDTSLEDVAEALTLMPIADPEDEFPMAFMKPEDMPLPEESIPTIFDDPDPVDLPVEDPNQNTDYDSLDSFSDSNCESSSFDFSSPDSGSSSDFGSDS
jgi:hypothetical protein